MKKFGDMSIRKKIFWSMLVFSVLIVMIITVTAIKNTYETVKEQLIYNRRMSIGWLSDRIDMEVLGYQSQVYEFEVDQSRKGLLQEWCIEEIELDYLAKWNLITAMNEVVSMNSDLNSMEIINLFTGKTLVAERSGASIEEVGDYFKIWESRKEELQSNLVFYRTEKEILVFHQMSRFEDNLPYALIVMHVRPYGLQDILRDIKMTADESIFILNDENQLIETDYGEKDKIDSNLAQQVALSMEQSERQEFILDGHFWFYREIGGGKLKVVLSVPDNVISESLSGTIWIAVIIGIVMLGICTCISIVLSRIWTKPIISLSDTMRTFTLSDSSENENRLESESSDNKEQVQNEIVILQDSFTIMVERNKRLIVQEYQTELEKREAQIHALQAQINPHFMYNVMQVIGGMALQKNAPEIYRVTGALGDLMRYCLNFSRDTVELKEEIHYLQSYCMLQNERFNGRIELHIQVADELLEYDIPKLILQPILENSFHHGLVNRPGNWNLKVEAWLEEESTRKGIVEQALVITVSDNGNGIPVEKLFELQEKLRRDTQVALKSDAHIGLCNVDARIRLNYPEGNYGVSIDSEVSVGTIVTVRMKAVRKTAKES